MKPYKSTFKKGDIVCLKKGQDLEAAYTELSIPASYGVYWVPPKEVCRDLAGIVMMITRIYYWHGGFPICTVIFTKDDEICQMRICEDFLHTNQMKTFSLS